MKRLSFFFLFLLFLKPSWSQKEMAACDVALEYADKKISPSINIFTHSSFLKYFAVTALVSLDEPIAEAYLGLSISPFPWVFLGGGYGLEFCETNPLAPINKEFAPRYLGNLWLGGEKVSFLGLFEQGVNKENYSYKASLSYSISEQWSASFVAWRFHGLGFRGAYKFVDSPASIFIFPAYDLESKSFKASIGASLDISAESLHGR